jgi:hypothetical protein
MLPRYQTQPGREVSSAPKALHRRSESLNGQRAHWSNTWHRLQSTRRIGLSCQSTDLFGFGLNTLRLLTDLQQKITTLAVNQFGQRAVISLDDRFELLKMSDTGWCRMAKLLKNRTQRIHQLCALTHKSLSYSKKKIPRLLTFGLRGDETHLRSLSGDDDRLGICCIVLLLLHERAHVLRGDQSDFVTQFGHLARPVMSTPTGLHHDRRRNLVSHEPTKTLPRQLPPELDLSGHGSSVDLKNTLGQIDSDNRLFGHARLPLHQLDLTRRSSNRSHRVGRAATTPSIQNDISKMQR